jgi:hypothetical protein
VRGLSCPVALRLTGGHQGDVPQAAALVENRPAQIVLAEAAYEFICHAWTKEPHRFRLNPSHHIPGPYT